MADDDQTLLDKLLNRKAPQVVLSETHGRIAVDLLDDGTLEFRVDGVTIHRGYSAAEAVDGAKIDTRSAERVSSEVTDGADELGAARVVTSVYRTAELELTQEVRLLAGGELVAQVHLARPGGEVETRYLAPFGTPYPQASARPVFLSLDQKMLRVPYDNDMWVRYESAVPDPGRESYDVTAIFDEQTLEGLVIGALDFDVWKNAITWVGNGSRAVVAYSGAASLATHDTVPHQPVSGASVSSARFVVFWSDDIKRGMEHYADLCVAVRPARVWASGTVPFGWNSYSGLGLRTSVETWTAAGEFVEQELPNYRDADDVIYVNLDGAFGLDLDAVRAQVDDIHARGLKAGWYAAPCGGFPTWHRPIAGTDLTTEDLLLRDHHGDLLPIIDHAIPFDVTHPAWEIHARTTIGNILALGFDYLKLDFLTHAGVEGAHHLAHYTGRMALNHAYEVLSDEIEKAGREIFVSLSIAPLFPYFLGHARRQSCDVFGRYDDTRYVLNAQNFSWWTSGRLYAFNDPDHTPVYRSEIDGREPSSENEARSRYISSVIAGTVMMLSDDFGPDGEIAVASQARARMFANTPAVNAVARLGRAFVPVDLGDGTTPFYTLTHEGRSYAAVFNFAAEKRTLSFSASRGALPASGRLRDLYSDAETSYAGDVTVELDGWDAVLLEVVDGSTA